MSESREIVETYGTLVYGIARARTQSKEDAEDVFQEVFLTYVKKHPALPTTEAARAWFARTTVHHCKTLWRTKGRHRTTSLDEMEEAGQEPGTDPIPEKDLTEDLRQAIEQLPKKYRQVLMMYYYAGLSTEEMAPLLGISANAVRIRLSRARKHLAKGLGEPQ